MSPRFGSPVIDHLLVEGRLEKVPPNREQAEAFLAAAHAHLGTAQDALDKRKDVDGAFSLAYDAAAKSLRAVLVNQGLRAKGGEGGHVAVAAALADQLKTTPLPVEDVRWMIRVRNAGEYGAAGGAPTAWEDVEEALQIACQLVEGAEKLLDVMWPY